MRDIVHIGMFWDRKHDVVEIAPGEAELGAAKETWITTTGPSPETSPWTTAYLAGTVAQAGTYAYLQLQYSRDEGLTWWACSQKFPLNKVGTYAGNIDVLHVDCATRNPIAFRLVAVNPGTEPEPVHLMNVSLVMYSA